MGRERIRVSVDLDAISRNVGITREAIGNNTLMLAVVKKNAYGHGLEQVAKVMLDAGVDRFGVADVAEAARLRQAGIGCAVHVLGPPLPKEMAACVEHDVTVTIPDTRTARAADEAARVAEKKLKCHIIVDTGMGRLGPIPDDAPSLALEAASLEGLEVEGAFTHFAVCDDPGPCRKQFDAFLTAVESMRSSGAAVPILHAAACGTIFSSPDMHLNMVRAGLCLLGGYNYCGMKESLSLHPAMRVTTQIVFMKPIPKNTPISYSGTCVTKRDSVVATIPFGYGDGYDFRLSNRGWVSVCGKRAPILGRVTMDYTMVDVTDIPDAEPGTEVIILGSPGPTAEELAQLASTVPHEVLCALGESNPCL